MTTMAPQLPPATTTTPNPLRIPSNSLHNSSFHAPNHNHSSRAPTAGSSSSRSTPQTTIHRESNVRGAPEKEGAVAGGDVSPRTVPSVTLPSPAALMSQESSGASSGDHHDASPQSSAGQTYLPAGIQSAPTFSHPLYARRPSPPLRHVHSSPHLPLATSAHGETSRCPTRSPPTETGERTIATPTLPHFTSLQPGMYGQTVQHSQPSHFHSQAHQSLTLPPIRPLQSAMHAPQSSFGDSGLGGSGGPPGSRAQKRKASLADLDAVIGMPAWTPLGRRGSGGSSKSLQDSRSDDQMDEDAPFIKPEPGMSPNMLHASLPTSRGPDSAGSSNHDQASLANPPSMSNPKKRRVTLSISKNPSSRVRAARPSPISTGLNISPTNSTKEPKSAKWMDCDREPPISPLLMGFTPPTDDVIARQQLEETKQLQEDQRRLIEERQQRMEEEKRNGTGAGGGKAGGAASAGKPPGSAPVRGRARAHTNKGMNGGPGVSLTRIAEVATPSTAGSPTVYPSPSSSGLASRRGQAVQAIATGVTPSFKFGQDSSPKKPDISDLNRPLPSIQSAPPTRLTFATTDPNGNFVSTPRIARSRPTNRPSQAPPTGGAAPSNGIMGGGLQVPKVPSNPFGGSNAQSGWAFPQRPPQTAMPLLPVPHPSQGPPQAGPSRFHPQQQSQAAPAPPPSQMQRQQPQVPTIQTHHAQQLFPPQGLPSPTLAQHQALLNQRRQSFANANTSLPPKQMWLATFETFYDLLVDSHTLSQNLQNQIRGSSALMETLRDSARVFPDLLDEKIVGVQADFTRDIQLLESKIERLEHTLESDRGRPLPPLRKPSRPREDDAEEDQGKRQALTSQTVERLGRLEREMREIPPRPVMNPYATQPRRPSFQRGPTGMMGPPSHGPSDRMEE